jgi:fatty acid desaturase
LVAGSVSTSPYTPYRQELLAPDRVRELSRLRPWRAAADVAGCWAVIVAAWAGAAAVGTWWAVVLGAIVVGNRYYSLWIIGHDGLHRRLISGKARNDLFTDLFCFGCIGAITRINNRNHLEHHTTLASEHDPDRHRHGCFNKGTRLSLAGYLTSLSSVARSLGNVFGRVPGAADEHDAPRAPRPAYRPRDIAIIAGWQLLLLVVLTLLFGWWGFIVMWWLPVFALAFLADNLRSFAEHSHPEADSLADEHRLISYKPPFLEGQLLSPKSMNFHAVHHLWPSIPYYNLAQADAEVRRAPGSEDLTWRGSYLAYLLRYSRAMPIEGCPPQTARG